jgi:hypothetical protein
MSKRIGVTDLARGESVVGGGLEGLFDFIKETNFYFGLRFSDTD